jgi:ribosomal protein S18 acetylase RimI-like enzyme
VPDFNIRVYEYTDFAAVCQLDTLCFPPRIAYEPEEIHYFLAQRGAICFVAETERGVVAWILGKVSLGKAANFGVGHIVTLDVHPDFRRRGVGESLMDTLENEFQRHGCARARLEVAIDNLGAQAFYQRREYKIVRTLRHYYADGGDAFRMERTL